MSIKRVLCYEVAVHTGRVYVSIAFLTHNDDRITELCAITDSFEDSLTRANTQAMLYAEDPTGLFTHVTRYSHSAWYISRVNRLKIRRYDPFLYNQRWGFGLRQ